MIEEEEVMREIGVGKIIDGDVDLDEPMKYWANSDNLLSWPVSNIGTQS
jgi:hypothetical protein